MKVRLSDLDLSDLERRYICQAIDSGWISSSGSFVEKAEHAFARFCETTYCSLVMNGTAALHAALAGLDVKPGDEVIVPGMTFVSPAQCVKRIGAAPVFADVEEMSWCIDPEEIQSLITSKTKGVIAVDVLGHPSDYDKLVPICQKHGLFLIEDAAEAHGSRYKGRRTGSFGDIATFSFFSNKTLATGEGGAVVSNDKELIQKINIIKSHGMTPEHPYWHEIVGDNWRTTNLTAALLLAQIERSDQIICKRVKIAEHYRQDLAGIPFLKEKPVADWAEVVPWLFTLQVMPGAPLTRDQLVSRLRNRCIDARAIWKPLVDLPPYRKDAAKRGTTTPRAKEFLNRSLWLPTSSTMTTGQTQFVIDEVRRAADVKGACLNC